MKFSRQSRLLNAAEFKSVFQQANRSGDESFRILARANEVQRHRLGMAVAKKGCPKAVNRNRIKRVIRENFRKTMANQTTHNAMDFVVLPTPVATDQSNKILDESLTAHWQRLIRKAGDGNSTQRHDRPRTQR